MITKIVKRKWFGGDSAIQAEIPVSSGTVIAKGDMLFLDNDNVKPASAFPWDTDLATTQEGFTAVFIGIALTGSADGETDPISVSVDPFQIWDAAVDSDDYVFGDTLAPNQGDGNVLANQELVGASAAVSIARAMEVKASASFLRVAFSSAYGSASSNTNSNIG